MAKEHKYKEAIDSMKKAGKETYTFTCDTGEICVLSQPSVKQSAKILPYIMPLDGNEIDFVTGAKKIVEECWVAGDDNIRKIEDLKIEVGMSALNIIQMKIAEVKKN